MTGTAGSLPRYFPKWMDRLGARFLDPLMRRLAPSLPGFAVVEHVGRRTGRQYATPVSIYGKDRLLAVVLLHGETDWVRNVVAAGHARVRHRGDTLTVRDPRIVGPREATAEVPRLARLGNRIAGIIVFRIG
ncbi:nitroreductase family deazaflavin-dependent oxidoreductase [Nocardia sp. NPDC001965]